MNSNRNLLCYSGLTHSWKHFLNNIMFAGWTLPISSMVSVMNQFEKKQLNSLTLLKTTPYKEYLIDSLIVCEIWCLFKLSQLY